MWVRLCYGKQDFPFNYSEFVCDSIDDIANLPTNQHASDSDPLELTCAIGSVATVLEDMTEYMLNSENVWTIYKDNTPLNAIVDIASMDEFVTYLGIGDGDDVSE